MRERWRRSPQTLVRDPESGRGRTRGIGGRLRAEPRRWCAITWSCRPAGAFRVGHAGSGRPFPAACRAWSRRWCSWPRESWPAVASRRAAAGRSATHRGRLFGRVGGVAPADGAARTRCSGSAGWHRCGPSGGHGQHVRRTSRSSGGSCRRCRPHYPPCSRAGCRTSALVHVRAWRCSPLRSITVLRAVVGRLPAVAVPAPGRWPSGDPAFAAVRFRCRERRSGSCALGCSSRGRWPRSAATSAGRLHMCRPSLSAA